MSSTVCHVVVDPFCGHGAILVIANAHCVYWKVRSGARPWLPSPTMTPHDRRDVARSSTLSSKTGTIRCWGQGLQGRLGYGNEENVGDDEVPVDVGLATPHDPSRSWFADGQCAPATEGPVALRETPQGSPDDSLVEALRRNRMGVALFGGEPNAPTIGRFEVHGILGRGGITASSTLPAWQLQRGNNIASTTLVSVFDNPAGPSSVGSPGIPTVLMIGDQIYVVDANGPAMSSQLTNGAPTPVSPGRRSRTSTPPKSTIPVTRTWIFLGPHVGCVRRAARTSSTTLGGVSFCVMT